MARQKESYLEFISKIEQGLDNLKMETQQDSFQNPVESGQKFVNKLTPFTLALTAEITRLQRELLEDRN